MEIRACRTEELEAVIALANRVFRPAGSDMGREYPLLFAPENREGLRIAADRTGPVALVGVCIRDASLLGARLRVAAIGSVCTAPEHRGQGLASALMADARRYARNEGASLLLISGGRGLYHRLGYVNAGRFGRYQLSVDQFPEAPSARLSIEPYREELLREIIALHQPEPVRFFRSARDWRRLLEAGNLMNARSELLVIHADGRPAAYAGVQLPNPRARRNMPWIQEFAGSRTALAAALLGICRRYQSAGIAFIAQPGDPEIRRLAVECDWKAETQSFSGTIGVIDPPALLAALRPLVEERCPEPLQIAATEERVRFMADGQQYEVAAPGPLAALLFGGDTDEARQLPPLSGTLGELLRTVFPLPLFWYGYSYV